MHCTRLVKRVLSALCLADKWNLRASSNLDYRCGLIAASASALQERHKPAGIQRLVR